jgi:hypothetical protein
MICDGPAGNRDTGTDPRHRSIFPEQSPLIDVAADLASQDLLEYLQPHRPVVGMERLCEFPSTQVMFFVAAHFAQEFVDVNQQSVAVDDGYSNGGVVKSGAKATIAFR